MTSGIGITNKRILLMNILLRRVIQPLANKGLSFTQLLGFATLIDPVLGQG